MRKKKKYSESALSGIKNQNSIIIDDDLQSNVFVPHANIYGNKTEKKKT